VSGTVADDDGGTDVQTLTLEVQPVSNTRFYVVDRSRRATFLYNGQFEVIGMWPLARRNAAPRGVAATPVGGAHAVSLSVADGRGSSVQQSFILTGGDGATNAARGLLFWDSTPADAGPHAVTVRATDDRGLETDQRQTGYHRLARLATKMATTEHKNRYSQLELPRRPQSLHPT
jgi:hypothetical protein